MRFSEEMLSSLRERVSGGMSDYRFIHTAEVEKMAVRLGKLYEVEDIGLLRAAALLHDVTKELDTQAQLELLRASGVPAEEYDIRAPKTLHAVSAPIVIKKEYPEFALPELLDAVRYHTTGRANMSLYECIIYLADYIDMSRRFEDCVYLRNAFFGASPEKMDAAERRRHLYSIMLESIEMTLRTLKKEGSPISALSTEAKAWLERELEE